MTCREVERLVTEDFGGAIADPCVRGHLESCSSCSQLVSELEEIDCLRKGLGNRALAPSDLPVRVAREFSRAQTRRLLFRVGLPVVGLLLWSAGDWFSSPSRPIETFEIREVSASPWALDRSGWEEYQWPASREQQYLEVVLPDNVEGSVVLRLPATIEVRQTDPGQDYLAYVSH